MSTTGRQDRQFDLHMKDDLTLRLESALEWIKENLTPEQVFDQDELEDWARSNGFVEEGAE